ncbi:hypothetical protein [Aerococcus urinaeequi]|uniref:hypothetical protein n=1 Tax=Aerococcus urinaeequi TaxID=51665 RepID=UPI003D6B69D2
MADEEKKPSTAAPKAKATAKAVEKYSKDAVINSGEFTAIERDLLKVVLKDDESYAIEDAKRKIKNYKEGEVK